MKNLKEFSYRELEKLCGKLEEFSWHQRHFINSLFSNKICKEGDEISIKINDLIECLDKKVKEAEEEMVCENNWNNCFDCHGEGGYYWDDEWEFCNDCDGAGKLRKEIK